MIAVYVIVTVNAPRWQQDARLSHAQRRQPPRPHTGINNSTKTRHEFSQIVFLSITVLHAMNAYFLLVKETQRHDLIKAETIFLRLPFFKAIRRSTLKNIWDENRCAACAWG